MNHYESCPNIESLNVLNRSILNMLNKSIEKYNKTSNLNVISFSYLNTIVCNYMYLNSFKFVYCHYFYDSTQIKMNIDFYDLAHIEMNNDFLKLVAKYFKLNYDKEKTKEEIKKDINNKEQNNVNILEIIKKINKFDIDNDNYNYKSLKNIKPCFTENQMNVIENNYNAFVNAIGSTIDSKSTTPII